MSEEKSEGKKMLLTAAFMALATFMAKALGLVRDSLIGAFFATGIEADAFMAASKVPTTLFDMVIGGVISASFIPIFSLASSKEGKREAMRFANKFITMVLMISVIIALVGVLFPGMFVNLIAPKYTGEKYDLTVQLTAIMFPMIIFTGLAFSCVGVLQSLGEYNIPSIISLVSNAAIILYFILFGKRFGVRGLAVTMVIAWSLQVVVQIPSLIRLGFRYKPDLRLRDRYIIRALKLAGPMLIATWVQPLYSIVNARLASGIDGAVSSLEYANRLYVIMTGVFSFVVTNLIFPKMSKANAAEDREQSHKLIIMSVKAICMIIMPLTAGVIILSSPITSIIYEHGSFSADKVKIVADALSCYSIGMLGLALNEVLSKYFFSMQDSKTPMRNSILSMIFNIVMAYILFNFYQTNGLALAAAGGSIFNALLNGICMARKYPNLAHRSDFSGIIKMAASTAVMSAAVYALYRLLTARLEGFAGNIILCCVCGFAGIVVYAAMLWITRVEEVRQFKK